MLHPFRTPLLLGVLIVGSLFSEQALAAQDLSLSALGTWNGSMTTEIVAAEAYQTVISQLGVAIANKPIAPGETLGVNGFDFGVNSTVAFIDSKDLSSSQPSAWSRVSPEQDGAPVLWIPGLQARKGLPFSLEIGANAGIIAFTHQTVFGGYGRWGLIEGYKPIPDITLQIGYSGYVGNDELELGVMDTSVTLGYTLPFGTIVGINQAQFSPYLGAGTLKIHAAPRYAGTENPYIGATPVSGFKSSDNYDGAYSNFVLHGGFRIQNGDFQLRMLAAIAPGSLVSMNLGLGFIY